MADLRGLVRLGFAAAIVVSSVVLIAGVALTAPMDAGSPGADGTPDEAVDPADGVTVITTDSNVWLADEGDGPRARSVIVAFNPDGSVLYYNDTYNRYWDVDPEGDSRVIYTASDHLNASECGGQGACTRNVVEVLDLETGEVTRIFERITPKKHSTRWHDVDRIDESRVVVADIHQDRVFVANTETDLIEWEWEASSEFAPESGGPYPEDWTHMNDVEVLDDGRYMVSLRNQDQVVFIDPATGMEPDWTLGEDDNHDILYEQHNPDYIPPDRGGPAVLVADSENNRVVEYQRTDGTWERTWTWRDSQMQWPRDADRLPNGHTLITDSNGDRVFEVNPQGEVVWQVDIAFPYEAERLETGDESAGGPSARSAELASHGQRIDDGGRDRKTDAAGPPVGVFDLRFDGPLYNSVAYLLPIWMGPLEALALVVLVVSLIGWGAIEFYWSAWSVTIHSPIRLKHE